ncbi:hypothetical protein [Mycolicibacterium mucogenicum]|uniref:Uncharacterized protein n=1 Tax=Mycolicibacterium mucogenicum TaxID=56689 RepID=A0A4R5WJ29_MYCMU|nr:hypothetical protein [Mycolicibacterium mucogenicum]TDK89959.1 hypothetical protein EUA03_10265 [Mycolicibacterium mucogenicum]
MNADQLKDEQLPEIGEACRDWRQGDVFCDGKTFVFDHGWSPQPVGAAYGAVIISQSCDASLPGRERIQIAPVVRLEDEDDLREALSGRRTQYLALPRIGQEFFADLDGITTVMKTALLSYERAPGVETDQEIREFAFSLARRFGRFAYPDEVVECFKPLTEALRSKARKENSPMGKVLADVHSFRVECGDWSTEPYALTLIVILEPARVTSDLDDIGDCPEDLARLGNKATGERIGAYAAYLNRDGLSQTERYFGWQLLADAWARRCEETATARGLTGIVSSVTAQLTSTDEFPMSQYLSTESLDLDYLSDSRKAPQ